MKKILALAVCGFALALTGCAQAPVVSATYQPAQPAILQHAVQPISAEEARIMMAEVDEFVLLDVRTEHEFNAQRIAGSILIPYDEIPARAEAELTDKDAVILVYCRSGQRSAMAASALVGLGFTNVYDFSGIINWPYETICC